MNINCGGSPQVQYLEAVWILLNSQIFVVDHQLDISCEQNIQVFFVGLLLYVRYSVILPSSLIVVRWCPFLNYLFSIITVRMVKFCITLFKGPHTISEIYFLTGQHFSFKAAG